MQEWFALIKLVYDYVYDLIIICAYAFCFAIFGIIGIITYHFCPITTIVVGSILVIGFVMIMVEEWQARKKSK